MVRRIPRWLARAPIAVFARGGGWLLGPHVLMLEHRGRVTGAARHVVLEVIDREPGALYIVSGYGERSQWFRNVCAEPAVRVWFGALRGAPARAERLCPDETRRRLLRYRERRGADVLGRVLGLSDLRAGAPVGEDVAHRLPVLRLVPR